jgi:nicotinamidase-related amidase
MGTNTALLIMNPQVGLMAGRTPAYQSSEVLERIRHLLASARASDTLVIYIQHDGDHGSLLEAHSPGWQIHPALAPKAEDCIIYKRLPDAFYGTPLHTDLLALQIKHLVVVGYKTECCIDTTSRRATSLGYDVTLVRDAHTTMDTPVLTAAQIIAHHNYILDQFGTPWHVITVKESSEITL